MLANHSLLAYYVLDEPKWPSVPEDLAMASAVAAGDPHQRPSLTLVCGIQCGEAKWNSTAYHQFASGNTIMAVDSYTEYKKTLRRLKPPAPGPRPSAPTTSSCGFGRKTRQFPRTGGSLN